MYLSEGTAKCWWIYNKLYIWWSFRKNTTKFFFLWTKIINTTEIIQYLILCLSSHISLLIINTTDIIQYLTLCLSSHISLLIINTTDIIQYLTLCMSSHISLLLINTTDIIQYLTLCLSSSSFICTVLFSISTISTFIWARVVFSQDLSMVSPLAGD